MVDDSFIKTHLNLMKTNVYCEYILNGKPPILLIHGLVESIYSFKPLMPQLAKHFSVIAIDLPGFGKSEKSTTFHYSYKNYARLIIGCLDEFNVENASLVGHSMGGQIALFAARHNPERINRLALINASAYMGKVYRWARMLSHLPFFHLAAKRIVRKNGIEDTLNNVLYDKTLLTTERIEEYGRPLQEKKFYKALIRLLRHREGDLTSEQLHEIHTPALLIWGEKDNVTPLHAGKQLANDLPNSKLVSFDKAGHMIMEERPDVVFEEIKKWCLSEK